MIFSPLSTRYIAWLLRTFCRAVQGTHHNASTGRFPKHPVPSTLPSRVPLLWPVWILKLCRLHYPHEFQGTGGQDSRMQDCRGQERNHVGPIFLWECLQSEVAKKFGEHIHFASVPERTSDRDRIGIMRQSRANTYQSFGRVSKICSRLILSSWPCLPVCPTVSLRQPYLAYAI